MNHSNLIVLILPILGLVACGTGRSSDVKQSTIEQSYELTYVESTAELSATADFRYENTLGTSLKLTGNSNISFNGTPMHYSNNLSVASYHLDIDQIKTPAGSHEFRYVNNDGEVLVTRASIPAPTVIKLPHEGDRVPGDRELQILMQGDPLVGSDELTLCLVYAPATPSATEIRECLHSGGPLSLVFSREQLARFPVERELSLEIKRESHPTQSTARIHVSQTFLSRPLHIILD